MSNANGHAVSRGVVGSLWFGTVRVLAWVGVLVSLVVAGVFVWPALVLLWNVIPAWAQGLFCGFGWLCIAHALYSFARRSR